MKRLNKLKGMYALLIVVAVLIGVTIYGSCSADEDYDGYSSKNELFTLADGEMVRGETPSFITKKTDPLTAIVRFDFIQSNPLYNYTVQTDTLYYRLNTNDFEYFYCTDYSLADTNIYISEITPKLKKIGDGQSYIIQTTVKVFRIIAGQPYTSEDDIKDTLVYDDFC